ncbi:MAG TPA: signal peptide peptidase SppA [Acidobacteriaceae bacterium]|nr:signal peptide peptidase SppA [Acidobacteriaceae bacterium]
MDELVEHRNGHSFWFWLSWIGGLFLLFTILLWIAAWYTLKSSGTTTASFNNFGSGSIGVVDLKGIILSPDKINEQLEKFANDKSIKAIILHIDSPGGGAAASQEIYHEVLRVRNEHKKRIVASIESVGASGAYYVASGTDRIYANQASIVGSIGVIMEWMNYGDLLKWAKLKSITIKAGELKDAGSPTRDPTPTERAYFQGLTDNMHAQFVDDVAAGRKLPVKDIQSLATGQVWTGQQALPLHLIDQIGGFRTTLLDTAKSVGIRGEPAVVRPKEPHPGLIDLLVGAKSKLSLPDPREELQSMLEKSPGFYFLWQ